MLSAESSLLEDGKHTTSRKNRTSMCSQCRHDKQKCNPADRDWHRLQQRCERCSKLGYACGPSERAQRKSRKSSSDTKTADLFLEDELLMSSMYTNQGSPWSSLQWGDPASNLPCQITLQNNGLSPPGPFSTCMSPDSAVHAAHDIPKRSAKSCTTELLTQLGDLYATRELLRRELRICEEVDSWTGGLTENTPQLRAAIQDFIRETSEEFEHCVKRTRYIVTTSMTLTMEKTMLELYLIAYKFANPPPATIDPGPVECAIDAPSQSNIQWLLHTLHETSSRHSIADFVCGSTLNPAPTSDAANTEEIYRRASTAVGRILAEIVSRSFEHKDMFLGPSTAVRLDSDAEAVFGYPACHLAAMHGHQFAFSELLRSCALRNWELDWLRRTPIHAAAYAGKIYELQYIFENSAAAAMDTSKDIFGLTPLMIAACKDDVKTFNLLRRHGADTTVKDLRGRSVLALAARNGSQSIVKLLLCQGCVPRSSSPESSELYEAIMHNRSAIIGLLISHYSQNKNIDQYDFEQIQAGTTVARQKGLSDIVEQLEGLFVTRSYSDIDPDSAEASCVQLCDLEQKSLESLASDIPYSADIAHHMEWNTSCPILQESEWTDLGMAEMTAVISSGTMHWT